jgi:hypothetical protein
MRKLGWALFAVTVMAAALLPRGPGGASAQPPERLFEPVAQLGGVVQAMVVRGDRLFVASGTALEEWDVGDPGRPRFTGASAVGMVALAELSAGPGTVYGVPAPWPTAATLSTLSVIDVSRPGAPRWLDDREGPKAAWRTSVDADLLLLHDRERLFRLRLDDPARPLPDGELDLDNMEGFDAEGGRVFVATGTGLKIVDTSRPELKQVSQYDVPQIPWGPRVVDVASDGSQAMLVGPAAQPMPPPSPRPTSPYSPTPYPPGYRTPTPAATPTAPPYLRVLAVGDIRAPRLVGELRDGAWDEWPAARVALDPRAGLAFVRGEDGMTRVVDVRDPARPVERSRVPRAAGRPLGKPLPLPGHVLLLDEGQLRSIDVRTPDAPREAARIELRQWAVNDIFSLGDVAVLAESAGLRVVDFTDRAAPRELAFVPLPQLQSMTVDGAAGRAWLLDGRDLVTLDLRDPAHPREVSRRTLLPVAPGYGYAGGRLAAAGRWLLVAGGDSGLRLLDLADPDHPADFSRFAHCRGAANVAWIDDVTAAVHCEGGVLEILDLHAPSQPVELGGVTGTYGQMIVRDGYLYVLDSRLGVLDVRDPARPMWQEAAFLDQRYADAVPAGGYLVAAGTTVDVLGLSSPGRPVRLASVPVPRRNPGSAVLTTLGLIGDDLVVADPGGAGLSVLVRRAPLPELPVITDTPTPTPTPSRTPTATATRRLTPLTPARPAWVEFLPAVSVP